MKKKKTLKNAHFGVNLEQESKFGTGKLQSLLPNEYGTIFEVKPCRP